MDRVLVATAVVFAAVVAGTAFAGSAPADGAVVQSANESPSFRMVARYPTDDGYRNETALTPDDVLSVSNVTEGRGDTVQVLVTLTESGARNFSTTLRETGFVAEGLSNCPADWRSADYRTWCLLTVVDGEVVYSSGLAPTLADSIRNGAFQQNPRIRILTENRSQARVLRAALAGEPLTTTTGSDADGRSRDGGDGGALPSPGFSGLVAAVGVVVGLLVAGRRRDG